MTERKAWMGLWVATLGLVGCDGATFVPDASLLDATARDGASVCGEAAQCDDGVFCNGAERCMPGPGASADGCRPAESSSPCLTGQACDEAGDRCVTSCDVDPDADGDGHSAEDCGGDDCDDANPLRTMGNAEDCDVDDLDEDCDPTTFGTLDEDADGHVAAACCNVSDRTGARTCGRDCNDDAPGVSPDVPEVCNGVDDDCDGTIDEGLLVALYEDADGDMFGDRDAAAVMRCPASEGFSSVATDCDDRDNAIFPGATETCDTVDEDCDGTTDEEAGTTYYRDVDRDGYGVVSMTIVACSVRDGYSIDAGDCNDMSAASRPFGIETCDGADNDCNGMVDEVLGSECTAGVGACMRSGRRRCDGTCSAVPGTPIAAAWATMPAPNGSWDWDCNGVAEPSRVGPEAGSQAAACASLTTADTCYSTNGYTVSGSGTPPPHCGAQHCYGSGLCSWGTTGCTAGNRVYCEQIACR